MSVVEIKGNSLNEKIGSSKKILVDCYADWCGPCRMLSPVIDEISEENKNYEYYKIDVDDTESEELCKRYGIMSIPTLLIFEDGELKEKVIGFKPKEELQDILNK